MLKLAFAACALLCALTINAESRQRDRTYPAHRDCNVTLPCEGVASSPRGEKIANAVGFGAAQKVYTSRATAHPAGCPSRASTISARSMELRNVREVPCSLDLPRE